MEAQLPKFEIVSYFVIWISTISYSMYNVYIDGNSLSSYPIEPSDFEKGWSFLSRKKDVSDYEWSTWIAHLYRCIPWFLFQILLAEVSRKYFIQALPVCHTFITFSFMICNYPPAASVFFIASVLFFYSVMLLKSKLYIWIAAIIFLCSINIYVSYPLDCMALDHYSNMMIHISAGWFVIKCIDYTTSELRTNKSNLQKLMDMAAYTFYFPCFHLGPFIPYSDFQKNMYLPFEMWTYSRINNFVWNLLRYTGWLVFFEVASHYFYCNALHFQIPYVISKGPWTLNGIGYCMGQYFFIKYTVIYGFMSTMAKVERYDAPPHPRCIHRVHRYSDMWRYFDRGFYHFIFRCIYTPICGKMPATMQRKLFASFLSFCFVYIWHGGTLTIFYWSLFNFIGITFEAVGKCLDSVPSLKLWQIEHISLKNMRRIQALLLAPLWVLAVISNFIFFGGHYVGMLYFKQFIFGPWQLLGYLMIISYCMCQVSIEVNSWMNGRSKNHKH